MTLHCCQHQVYAVTQKTKYDYVYMNFKNVLTIRWYFLASNFLQRCRTASEYPEFLLEVTYLLQPQTC